MRTIDSDQRIKALLARRDFGSPVTVHGWVRTKRDSKGGFSFVHVNDGSSLDSLQAVADGNLDNYESEILEVNTGCAVRVSGTLVESGGKGQDREIQANTVFDSG